MSSPLLSKPNFNQHEGLIQHITPENAQWEYVGFDVYQLSKQQITLESGENELCLVFVTGFGSVYVDDYAFENIGNRTTPFEKFRLMRSISRHTKACWLKPNSI